MGVDRAWSNDRGRAASVSCNGRLNGATMTRYHDE